MVLYVQKKLTESEMTAIILTWDEGEDIEILSDGSGKQLTFKTVEKADSWAWDNPSEIKDNLKIVEL